MVAAATGDHAIKLFDVETQKTYNELTGFTDSIQSMSFNATGTLMVATCRDRKLRLFDTRAHDSVQTVESHGGIKGARTVWCGDRPNIITTGFSKMSERQMFLWDATQFSKPLKTVSLDSSNGIIMPFWSDNNIVFLAGKGDGNIRYYELESDELHYLTEYKSIEPQSGMTFLPRRALNVNENEIARAFKVTASTVQPLSFYVPRRAESFQADIFPPAPSAVPVMTASEFFDEKKTAMPHMLDLQTMEETEPVPLSSSNAGQMSVTSEAPKGTKEASEEVRNEAPKEQPKDAPQEKPQDAPKEQPKEAPKESASASPEAASGSKAETAEATPQPGHTEAVAAAGAAAGAMSAAAGAASATKTPAKSDADAPQKEASTPDAAPAAASSVSRGKDTGAPKDAPTASQATTPSASAPSSTDRESLTSLQREVEALKTQVAERDTRIRELEVENETYVTLTYRSLRTNQQRMREMLLSTM